MPLSDMDLKQSANHPTDDTSTAGGAMTSTLIDDSTVGEWVPNLDGQIKGGSIQYQWQAAYLHNDGVDSITGVQLQIHNFLNESFNDDQIEIVSIDAGDGSGKFVRLFGTQTDAGPLKYEDVTLSASSVVTSTGVFAKLYRAELRSVSTGAIVTAAADIEIREQDTNDNIGFIRAGYSVATNEWSYGKPASKGDQGTFANRRTEPSSLTYSDFNGVLSLPDFSAGDRLALYCRQTIVPGMPSIEPVLQLEITSGSPSGTIYHFHKGKATQKMASLPTVSHIGESVFETVTTVLKGHHSKSTLAVSTGIYGHSSAATPTNILTALFGHYSKSINQVDTNLLGHHGRAAEALTSDLMGHSSSAKTIVQTGLLGHNTSTFEIGMLWGHSTANVRQVQTDLLGHSARQLKAPATVGGVSAWEDARITNDYNTDNLTVTFTSSTGGSAALCQTHTLVIEQSASENMTFSINLNDPLIQWHPYGDGTYKDVMADGAEVSMTVAYEGAVEDFFGTFKSPSITMDGGFATPSLAWPGVCEGAKMFDKKVDLPTLNYDPLLPVTDKRTAMYQATDAAGVSADFSGIKNQKLSGPYHRQQVEPGQLVEDLLERTLDHWRTEYKTIKGYDPDNGGQTWTYDLDNDEVRSWPITPQNNKVYTKVKVIRAIATGSEVTDDGALLEVSDFGQYEMTFNPPISLATTRVEYDSNLGAFSNYLWYRGNDLVAARRVVGYNGLTVVSGNRIWNCDKLVVTWGERNPNVTATSSPGALRVFGRQEPQGEVGQGINASTQTDQVTQRIRGSGDKLIELSPDPLFASSADMDLYGDRYLARIARAQVQHGLTLPLNHLIRCGDKIELDLGKRFGNNKITLLVTQIRHSISAIRGNRNTQLTCVEWS